MLDAPAPWWLVGPLLGLVIVALFALINGRLGVVGGITDALDTLRGRERGFGWRSFFLLGIVLGGAAFALAGGHTAGAAAYGWLRSAAPSHPTALVAGALLVGGVLIGYGARTAGGCTSGNGLSGSAIGSVASMVATATFMATAVVASFVLRWLL